MKTPILLVLTLLAAFSIVQTLADAILFHQIQSGPYQTPWYDARWWHNPYISFRVSLADSHLRWTKNAAGGEWLVRETMIDGKEWWTVVEKREPKP
jgi:hypothetical protein